MITIKPDRSAFIPQGEELIGYENDHGVTTREFVIKELLPETCVFRIDVENTSDIIIPETTSLPDGRTILTWTVTSAVTQTAGVITVQLRAFDADGTLIWHSAPIDFRCERSVHAVNEASAEPVITEFEQIEQRVEAASEHCEECAEEAADTLQALIDEVGDVSDTIRALGEHLTDYDNPHSVTAAEVGAYTKAEADTLLGDKIPVSNGTAYGSFTVAGQLHILDIDAEKTITVDPDDMSVSGVNTLTFADDAEDAAIENVKSITFDPDASGTISGLRSTNLTRSDAATKGYVDDTAGNKVAKSGDTITGELNVAITSGGSTQTATLGGNALSFDAPGHIKNLTAAPDIDEAASRRYVDGVTSGYYTGADLTSKFSDEIWASRYSGNAWAWIKARITAGNFAGLLVGDYIPFTVGGNTYHAEIAGINTYKGVGDVEILNHIDFITRELYSVTHKYNPVKINNGTKFGDEASTDYPWLASDVYLWLNSLSGTVASEAVAGGGTGTSVDYTADGVYAQLPADLKAVISEKRMYTEKRFNASSLRTASQGNAWVDIGKLWLPTEIEIFGAVIRGTIVADAFQMIVQYPLFAGTEHRVKKRAGQTSRSTWGTMQMATGTSENICNVHASGYATPGAADANMYYPICFRVAADAPTLTMSAPNSEGGDEV